MEYSDSHCASTIKEVIAHRGIKVTDQLRGGEGGAGTCALVPTVHQYGMHQLECHTPNRPHAIILGVMLANAVPQPIVIWHYYWVKGWAGCPSRHHYKALAALRIASPQEVLLYPVSDTCNLPVFLRCPFPQR
jgi:hypothetical protein